MITPDPIYAIDVLGYISPFLLLAIAAIILFAAQRYITLAFYITGFAATDAAVRLIKSALRVPRPGPQIPFMSEELKNSHVYGLPSGHSAEVFYTLAFMWFGARRIATPAFFYGGAFAALCMMYQRWAYRRHTVFQLLCGAVLGVFMGWAVAWLAKQRIQNSMIGVL